MTDGSMKEERQIYCDEDLQIEIYEFKGIAQSFKPHFHDLYVIGVMEEGEREYVCGGKRMTLRRGDILLINPLESHGCTQIGRRRLSYFSLNIKKDIMRKAMLEITGKDEAPHFSKNAVRSPDLEAELRALRNMVVGRTQDFAKEELFLLILERLASDYAQKECGFESRSSEKINAVCAYLEKNFDRNIRLEELSSLADMSKFHLIRSFAKQKGISPHKYLEAVRIKEAKKMLENGEPLIEAALKTGMTDQSHFANLFKSFIGLTPKTYQKIMRGR